VDSRRVKTDVKAAIVLKGGNMGRPSNQLKERKCPVCGKSYIFRDNWAYKITYGDHIKSYCSWGCLRKKEKEDGKA